MNGDQTNQVPVTGQATQPATQPFLPATQTAAAPVLQPQTPAQSTQQPTPQTQLISSLESESDATIQKQPAAFGMRVATQQGIQEYEKYLQNGGDPEQVPIYDRLAVAIAKDPAFLTKRENLDAYIQLVQKPLEAQSWGSRLNQALDNIGPSIAQTVQNVGAALVNGASTAKDQAELAFRKATGLTHDPGYETLESRLATELATTAQGTGQAVGDAWNFVSGVYNGVIQTGVRPVANLFANDAKSKEDIERTFAGATQDTVASQQKLVGLGKTLQDFSANAYKSVGAFADLGQKIETAKPDEAAAQGVAALANPLNFLTGEAGEAVVGAFKPLFFEKGMQAIEDTVGANARKFVLDSTQIQPENPGLSAADPAYIPTRNLQSQLAPAARTATQDAADAAAAVNQHLTTIGKIAGDPGTATWFGSQVLQKTGAAMETVGNLAEKATEVPDWIGNKLTGNHPVYGPMIADFAKKMLFGEVLEHAGPIGIGLSALLEHAPELANNFADLFKTAGKELMYGEATLPYWQRVASKTDAMPKFLAQALDSPAVQTATTLGTGLASGAATGAVLGGLQGAGTMPGGGVQGAVGGAAQGGIFGMAGAGFGQWQRFRDPNQYLLQARGDWQRYRNMLSPQDQTSFGQLSPTNQLLLAQSAQHFPALKVNYVNDPTGPQGFHYFDAGGRSNIQINLANPDSVVRGIMSHELIHAATHSGMLPNLYDSLFGDPKTGQIGQYTWLDADGKPVGINPDTGRYYVNQDFRNLQAQYTNKMTQNGLPTDHINDFAIAKEIYAEHGVDYMLSGAPILDSNSAYRPILTSTNALKTGLAKMGYTFDENGVMIGGPGGVTGTGLFTDLQRNPDVANLAKSYFTQRFHDGTSEAQESPSHRFTKKDMQNPNVSESFLNTAAEIKRNPDGSAQRDPLTGQPIYRTPKEVKDYNATFAQAVRSGLDTIPEEQRMALGMRQTEEGNTFIRYLPDSILDSLAATNQYNPHQIAALRMMSRVLADAGNPGAEMRAFYHKALTAGKTYRGLEGSEKIFVPYGIEVTKDNNVNLKSVDFNQLTLNYQRMQKRAPFKALWNSPDDFAQDAHTYFSNHKDGQPGATGIGEAKRNAINALANFGTGMQREANPLTSTMPSSVRPIIKSYRIDRTNQLSATGSVRPFISEQQYRNMNANYLPK